MNQLPLTKMSVSAKLVVDGQLKDHGVYEGEALMSQQQQDFYKDIVGNGLAKVSVGRDLSEKDFGNGGGVMVNITLTCDQGADKLNMAVDLAYKLADAWCWHYQGQIKQQLVQSGILK